MVKKLLFVLLVSISVTNLAAAAPSDSVAVLYNGNSPVNMDALHFMTRQFADLNSGYRLQSFRDSKDLDPGAFKAVLVLNTGMSTGIDRTLAKFINSMDDKSKVILINLRKGSHDASVTFAEPSPDTLGVDAISAASLWTGRGLGSFFGGKNSSAYDMHVEWVTRVIALIDRLN